MADNTYHKVCEACGRVYANFCVYCAQAHRQELVEELMDKYGMSVEDLIKKLSHHIDEDNMAALSLAITLKNMKPASKTDITSDGKPLSELKDVKTRLVDKIARVTERNAKS